MKNNNKTLVVIIVLLTIVIALLAGYIVIDKLSTSKTNEITDKENSSKDKQGKEEGKEETVTFSDSELEKYINYISPISIGPSALLYNTQYVSVDKLSAADKIKYIGSYVYSNHTSSSNYEYDIISENDVKNAVEEVYGPNTYEKTTFNLICGDYILNENEKNYYSKTGCGGTSEVLAQNVIITYKATNKKLEITTAYAFADGMTNKIYKDFDLKNAVEDITNQTNLDTYLQNYIKSNQDKLNHIVYTFESNDGKNYYFKEFTNNK